MTRAVAGQALAAVDFRPLWQLREHLPLLSSWLWQEWGRDQGYALTEAQNWLSDFALEGQRQTGVVALNGGEPLGVALLRDEDLESRKDLSPWLSSLFVETSARNQGIGSRLVREIEQAAIERNVPTLYLYTLHQSRFYADLGWSLVETFSMAKSEAYLMCKTFLEEKGIGLEEKGKGQ